MSDCYDWIFFDCFNTLIDDFDDAGEEHGLCSLPDFAAAEGLFSTREEFIATYLRYRRAADPEGGEVTLPERLHRTLAAGPNPVDPSRREALVGAMLRLWQADYARLLRPTPGVGPMLEYSSARKPLAVISNFFLPDEPGRYLARFGLARHFRFIVDSARFGRKKPHPAIFHEACDRAGLPLAQAGRVLYLGDRTDLDVETPRALGMQVIHFHRGKSRPHVSPTPTGVRRISDWAEFR